MHSIQQDVTYPHISHFENSENKVKEQIELQVVCPLIDEINYLHFDKWRNITIVAFKK